MSGKKRWTKVVVLLLVLTLTLSLFTSCGKNNDDKEQDVSTNDTSDSNKDSNDDKESSGSDKEDGVFPISEEPIEIKILKPLVMYDSEYGDMELMKELEEKSNVKVEWDTPPAADFSTKYQMIMASGNLPDAIIAMPADDIQKYGQEGALIDLRDIIDEHMPNLQKVLEAYPAAQKVITANDGNIYSMPFVYRQQWGNTVMIVREDWLEKLDLDMPETIDDWYEVLKAFKTGDPNGNGEEDEWAFSGDSIADIRSFSHAWGIFDNFYVADKMYPQDDKVHFGPIEPRFKEALEWITKIYSEGLVDPEIVTNDMKAFQAKATQDLVGATRGSFGGDLMSMNDAARNAGDEDFHMVVAPVPEGPYGDKLHMYPDPKALPQGFVITSANKNPVETAKWADWWYGEEGQKAMWGIEGETYVMEDGEPKWTEKITSVPEGKTEIIGSYTPGRSIFPSVWWPASLILQNDSEEVRYAKEELLKPEFLAEPLPPGLGFEAEDNDRRIKLLTDINTYVDESINNFIVGRTPLSEWDNYVEQVKAMNIDEVIEIYQRAYDAWKDK